MINGHHAETLERADQAGAFLDFLEDARSAYRQGVNYSDWLTSKQKARDPLRWSPWAFAGARTIVNAASQAPLMVFRESDVVDRMRREAYARDIDPKRFQKRFGRRRLASRKWITRSGEDRFLAEHASEIEPIHDHPILDVLARPNPMQSEHALLSWTDFNLVGPDGEAFWLQTKGGRPIDVGETPDEIWPIPSAHVTEIYEGGQRHTGGRIVAWEISRVDWLPRRWLGESTTTIELHQLIQFAFVDPRNPARGMSPLAAATESIEIDILCRVHNRKLLARGAQPRGYFREDGPGGGGGSQNLDKFVKDFQREFGGAENSGKTPKVPRHLKWERTALTMQELDWAEGKKDIRDEILAVLNVPGSTIGSGTETTYAGALVGKLLLWEMAILPIFRIRELALDAMFFNDSPDRVFPLHQLSNIEAFRAGLAEKIKAAKDLAGVELRTPPRTAYEAVGVKVPSYDGDDEWKEPPKKSPESGDGDGDGKKPEGAQKTPKAPGTTASKSDIARADAKATKAFLAEQEPLERAFAKEFRGWVTEEQKAALERFDGAVAKRSLSKSEAEEVLGDLAKSRTGLAGRIRGVISKATEAASRLMIAEGMVPPNVLDAAYDRIVEGHVNILSDKAARAMRKRLKTVIGQATKRRAKLADIRAAIADVYATALGTGASTFATTATVGAINAAKAEMIRQAGLKGEWIDQDDDRVRAEHTKLGEMGPVDLPHNFAPDVGYTGTLEYPGDPRAEYGAIARCRCTLRAVRRK